MFLHLHDDTIMTFDIAQERHQLVWGEHPPVSADLYTCRVNWEIVLMCTIE